MALTQITKDFITRAGIVVKGTAAVSSSTGSAGALQVDAGASIAKNIVVGSTATVWGAADLKSTLGVDGAVTIYDATAGSTSTGALKLTAGGASIAGAVFVNDTTAAGASAGSLVVAGGQYLGGDLWIDGSTAGGSTAGALRVNNGGAWVSGDVHIGGSTAGGANAGALVVGSGGGYIDGDLYVDGSTAASSSAGALRVSSGGLSVAQAAWINSTSTAVTAGGGDGALRVAGGAYIGDNLIVNSLAFDTGTNTANALYVAGGAWIDKTLFVDGDVTFNKNFTVNGTATYVYSTVTMLTDNILELHKSPTGTWATDDGKDVGTVFNYFKGSAKQAFLGWDNSSTYLEWWQEGSEDATGNFVGTTWGTFKTGSIKLTDTTAATNTSTGALTVEGGVGIGGDLWVKGTANFGGSITGTITTATNLEGGGLGYIPIQNAAGQTSFIAAGTAADQVLTWDNTNSTATWQSAASTQVGAATTATNIAGGDTGQIPFQSAAGLTTFDSQFNYDDTNNTLNLLNVNSTGTIDAVNIDVNAGSVTLDGSSSLTLNQLTANKVAFVNNSNVLSTDAELSYDDTTDTLGVVNVNVNTGTVTMSAGSTLQLNQLDYNSVPFVSSTGALNTDGAAFAYDPATDTLDVVNIDVNAGTMTFDSSSTITVNQLGTNKVAFVNASNVLSTDTQLGYDDTTDTLDVVNVDVNAGTMTFDSSSTITVNQLGTNKVAFVNASNVLSTDTELSYDDTTDTLDVKNVDVNAGTMTFDSSSTITVNQLGTNKVAFVNASNVLSTDAELSYDDTTDTLDVKNVDVNAGTVTFDSSSTLQLNQLATNSVAFVGSTGALETDTGFTYDATADLLTVANFTATNQLWVANTATVDGDLYVNGDIFLKGAGLNTISASTGTFDYVTVEGTGTGLTVVDGAVIQGTTQATSTSSGAFQVTGGAAIGGNAHVGGDLYVTGTAHISSISIDGATLQTLTVVSTTTLQGPVFATSSTQADGSGFNTGAVQLDGGLLVKKNIVAGGLVIGGDYNGQSTPTTATNLVVEAFYSNNNMQASFTSGVISGSSEQNLDVFDATKYTTAKYLVQVKDGSDVHSAEILLIHDGTDSYLTEYAIITNNGELGVFGSDLAGGNVTLKFVPTSATAMRIQVVRQSILTTLAAYAPT